MKLWLTWRHPSLFPKARWLCWCWMWMSFPSLLLFLGVLFVRCCAVKPMANLWLPLGSLFSLERCRSRPNLWILFQLSCMPLLSVSSLPCIVMPLKVICSKSSRARSNMRWACLSPSNHVPRPLLVSPARVPSGIRLLMMWLLTRWSMSGVVNAFHRPFVLLPLLRQMSSLSMCAFWSHSLTVCWTAPAVVACFLNRERWMDVTHFWTSKFSGWPRRPLKSFVGSNNVIPKSVALPDLAPGLEWDAAFLTHLTLPRPWSPIQYSLPQVPSWCMKWGRCLLAWIGFLSANFAGAGSGRPGPCIQPVQQKATWAISGLSKPVRHLLNLSSGTKAVRLSSPPSRTSQALLVLPLPKWLAPVPLSRCAPRMLFPRGLTLGFWMIRGPLLVLLLLHELLPLPMLHWRTLRTASRKPFWQNFLLLEWKSTARESMKHAWSPLSTKSMRWLPANSNLTRRWMKASVVPAGVLDALSALVDFLWQLSPFSHGQCLCLGVWSWRCRSLSVHRVWTFCRVALDLALLAPLGRPLRNLVHPKMLSSAWLWPSCSTWYACLVLRAQVVPLGLVPFFVGCWWSFDTWAGVHHWGGQHQWP